MSATEAVGDEPLPSTGADEPSWADEVARATAWALLVLVPVHVVATLVLDDPGSLTAATALDRWASPTWRALDWVLVVVAVVHASLGLWRRLLDGDRATARVVAAGLVVLGAGLLGAAMTVAVLRPVP